MSRDDRHERAVPGTVGLCPDPSCTNEFYMPDATPGDRCPMSHDDESPLLVIFARSLTDEDASDPTRRLLMLLPGPRSPDAVLQPFRLAAITRLPEHVINAALDECPDAEFVLGREGGGGPVVDGWRRKV